MRRTSIWLTALSLALSLPAVSTAAEPIASIAAFKVKVVPIPKPGGGSWPHTGNILGAGSDLEAEWVFEGSGYGASPQNPKGSIPLSRRSTSTWTPARSCTARDSGHAPKRR